MGDIALVDGCFDPFHPGHQRYLRDARRLADDLAPGTMLTCQVASDRYVSTKHVPLLTQEDRAQLLAPFVDDILTDDVPVADTITSKRPKLYIKGCDWRTTLPADIRNACKAVGCEIEFTNTVTHTSSEILNRYREASEREGLEDLESFIEQQDIPPEDFDASYFERQGFTLDQRREIEGKHPYLIRSVFQPKKVLDYGCGPGHLVTLLKESGLEEVTGYDPNVPEFSIVPRSYYDLVICREVFEHIPVAQYLDTVYTICDLSSRFVYLTARFHPSPQSLYDVQGADDLDPTHISMVNITLLRSLFTLSGMVRRTDYEAQMDHQNQHRVLVYEH